MPGIKTQRGFAWCGIAFVVVFFTGLLIAGFIPPMAPSDSAAKVAARYQADHNRILLGSLIMMIAAAVTIPFVAAISVQLRRIEGRFSPLCLAQLVAGSVGVLSVTFPVIFFAVAAYRPGRSPEITQAINDLGWFPFIANFPFASAQCFVIAIAALRVTNGAQVFPRWLGYYNIWTGVLFAPAGLLFFFKDGPFAWNGLISFWFAATIFGTWFLVMSWAVLRATRIPEISVEDELGTRLASASPAAVEG